MPHTELQDVDWHLQPKQLLLVVRGQAAPLHVCPLCLGVDGTWKQRNLQDKSNHRSCSEQRGAAAP